MMSESRYLEQIGAGIEPTGETNALAYGFFTFPIIRLHLACPPALFATFEPFVVHATYRAQV